MASFNRIKIVGYLGRDPELRYTGQGTAFCNFSVATTEKRKDLTGAEREHTTWFHVTGWARQAEWAGEHLSKGRLVYVEGRLRIEIWTDRDGLRRTSLEVAATDIRFIGPKSERSVEQADEVEESDPEDNDVPF